MPEPGIPKDPVAPRAAPDTGAASPAVAWRRIPLRWRALALLSLARLAMGFQFQAVGATGHTIQAQYGVDLTWIGWLVGLYLLPGIALALPSGLLGARFGAKPVALAGMALMMLGGLVCALAGDTATLAVGRLLCGAGGVLFSVIATKMIADWFAGHELVLAMSVLVNTWPIGIALALLVLGDVAAAQGTGAAFGVTAVAAAAALALLAFGYRSPVSAAAERGTGLGALVRREWQLLLLAGAAWMVFNVVYAVLASFLPLVMIEQGTDVTQANWLTALMTLLIIGSVPGGGWLAERTGRPTLIAVASLVLTAMLLVAMHLQGPSAPLLVATGLVIGLPVGTLIAAPAQFLRPQTRAVGMGVFHTIFYLGMGVLPAIVAAMAQRLGSVSHVLTIGAAMVVLTAGLIAAVGWRLAVGRSAHEASSPR
ncbi:MAG TPA: MFS transporter [Thermomicrobiales bacterium]|nr:MFS transporter [Thermomicrobiales bacterium]